MPLSPHGAGAAQRRRAHPLPRLRRHRRRADRPRGVMPLELRRGACGRADRVRRADALRHRLASRSRASSGCSPRRRPTSSAKLFSAKELADSGDGAGPRGEPCRALRSEGGVRQALSARARRWAQIEPADFSVARDDYGAPHDRVRVRMRAGAARPPPRIADIAVSLTHDRTQRLGGGAGAADASTRCRSPAAAVPLAAVSPARRARQPAARVRRRRARSRDRRASRRRTTRTCGGSSASSSLPLAVARRRSARWCASRTSSVRPRVAAAARAC